MVVGCIVRPGVVTGVELSWETWFHQCNAVCEGVSSGICELSGGEMDFRRQEFDRRGVVESQIVVELLKHQNAVCVGSSGM